MPKESGVVICPNPRCHKKIEEPILLNNLSTTPAEQYYACPHCFIRLDEGAENSEDVTEETTSGPSVHPSLEKVLDAISAQPQTEKKEKEEEEEKEEKKKKEEPPTKSPEKEGKEPSGCPHEFGYLANRAKDAPIPPECLICPKIVDCMLKRDKS